MLDTDVPVRDKGPLPCINRLGDQAVTSVRLTIEKNFKPCGEADVGVASQQV